MKKIISAYKQYEQMSTYRAPEFRSDATEFHVILWNLNYGNKTVKDADNKASTAVEFTNEFTNEFTKEYRNAQRQIYHLISSNPKTTIKEMAKKMGVTERQAKKYNREGNESVGVTGDTEPNDVCPKLAGLCIRLLQSLNAAFSVLPKKLFLTLHLTGRKDC